MGRSQREKGKRVERLGAAAWREAIGGPARRSAQFCGSHGTGDLIATDGIHIEVKGRKNIAVLRFFEQAETDANDGDVPIVLLREDRNEFFVLLKLADVPAFVERIQHEPET